MSLLSKALLAVFLFVNCNTHLAQSTLNSPSPAPVSLTVTVTNEHGEIVSGLPQNAFTISDDGGIREIISFNNEDAPLSIVILLDLSGSVKTDRHPHKIKYILDGLTQFIQKSHPANEYFIIGHDTRLYLLLDGARDANAALSTLQKLSSKDLSGNTAFYDACLFGIEKIAQAAYPKQVMLLITDGRDNSSQYKLSDVRRLLKEKNVLVYSLDISLGLDTSGIYDWNSEGPQVLEELASLTGGKMHSPGNQTEIKTRLERIASELRQQYVIKFLPTTDASKSKWHPLKIRVSLPTSGSHGKQKLSARTRKGYYSTPS
jgi:Ca-activated chloride channel family protein